MKRSRLRWNSTIRGRPAARSVESWSWCLARACRDVEGGVAGVVQAPAEVALVVVDEEIRIEVADLRCGRAAHEHRARLRPVDPPDLVATALHREEAVEEERADKCGATRRESARRRAPGCPAESSSCAPAAPAASSLRIASSSASTAPGRSSESSLSRRQNSPRARSRRSESFSALPVRVSRSISSRSMPRARTASADPSSDALSRTSTSRSTPGGWCASIAARHCIRKSRPFVFTTA